MFIFHNFSIIEFPCLLLHILSLVIITLQKRKNTWLHYIIVKFNFNTLIDIWLIKFKESPSYKSGWFFRLIIAEFSLLYSTLLITEKSAHFSHILNIFLSLFPCVFMSFLFHMIFPIFFVNAVQGHCCSSINYGAMLALLDLFSKVFCC